MTRKWIIHESLGRGGFGQVFRARLADGRQVAIKQIACTSSASGPIRALQREAEIGAKLDHPNIVKLIGVETESTDRVYLLMELVEGLDLARLLCLTRVPVDVTIYIARSLLAALAHVHEQAGVAHRDLSPHNVLISWDGDVKLSDFGIAKPMGEPPTNGGHLVGKLRYMSPEQFQRDALDARSDLFVVGVLLYQLLTGNTPESDTQDSLCTMLAGAAKPAPLTERCPGLSPELCAVVMRLLEHERADRYPSAQQALEALPESSHGREALSAIMRNLRELGLVGRHAARRKGHRRGLLRAAALLGLGAGLGVAALWLMAGAPAGSRVAPQAGQSSSAWTGASPADEAVVPDPAAAAGTPEVTPVSAGIGNERPEPPGWRAERSTRPAVLPLRRGRQDPMSSRRY